ncbi:unnamed protein product [Clonostachys rosea]|uniref:DUF1531-domain-containing protein n=1 Tax=Bionectria ochroleuca TaxID=29856 RepID=A0ABY6TRA4_BIOOC|nr:unnamed protein product [Clonostachys rosea]
MDSQSESQQSEQDKLNDFGRLTLQVAKYGQNMSNNLHSTFANMTVHGWIRLIVIVGGYMLLRPYALKYLGKRQFESMEEQERKDREEEEKRGAKISPNQLRGQNGATVNLDEDEEEFFEEDEGKSSATRWGQKARIRQRTMIKDLLEREERRRQEEEDDKDIEDLLED